MICSKCGTENPDYYVFCTNCFSELKTAQETPQASKPAEPARTEYAPRHVDKPAQQYARDPWQNAEDMQQRRPTAPRSTQGDAYAAQAAPTRREHQAAQKNAQQAAQQPQQPQQRPQPVTRMREIDVPEDEIDGLFGFGKKYTHVVEDGTRTESAPPPPKKAPVKKTEVMAEEPQDYYDYAEEAPLEAHNQKKQAAAERKAAAKVPERQDEELPTRKKRADDAYYDANDAYYEDYYDYYDEGTIKRDKRRSRTITIIFAFVLVLLIALVVLLALKTDLFSGILSKIGIGGGSSAVTVETTSADLTNGVPMHSFFIAGGPNETLIFKDIGLSYELNGGEYEYRLPDSHWIPVDPDPSQSEYTIKPNIVLRDSKGTEKQLEVPEITVTVPQVTLMITSPGAENGNIVSGSTINISGNISATGTRRLYIDDIDISAAIDPNGNFSYDHPVPFGEFSFTLTASAARNRSVSTVISGVRERTEISVKLDNEYLMPVNMARPVVTGRTEPGAELVVTGSRDGDITYNEATGEFSFTAQLGSYGRHKYSITATIGGVTGTKDFTITYAPEVNEYTSKATTLNYRDVYRNPNDNKGKTFTFNATVTEILTSADSVRFLAKVDGSSNLVLVDYYGVNQIEMGKTYRIYADANTNDTDKSAIKMNAYYVYLQ